MWRRRRLRAAVGSHWIIFNMFSVFAVWGLKMFRSFVPALLLLRLLTCSAHSTGESTGKSTNVISLYIIHWKAVVHAIIVILAFTRHFLLFNFSKRELELMTNYYFFDKIFFQFMDHFVLLLVGQLKRIPLCHNTRCFDLFHYFHTSNTNISGGTHLFK